ncbi:MAG: hypothetical protein ACLS89_02245 [Collinsella sp.]
MRNVNWGSVQASTDGGDFKRPAPGGYVARLVSLEDNDAKQYVEAVFDIAEGEFANYYSDDWGQAHPYAHHFFGATRTRRWVCSRAVSKPSSIQPGFDPFAAWDAGRLDMFANRLVGINLQEEEYEYNGEVKTRLNVCQVVPVQDVRDGKVKPKDTKKLSGDNAPPLLLRWWRLLRLMSTLAPSRSTNRDYRGYAATEVQARQHRKWMVAHGVEFAPRATALPFGDYMLEGSNISIDTKQDAGGGGTSGARPGEVRPRVRQGASRGLPSGNTRGGTPKFNDRSKLYQWKSYVCRKCRRCNPFDRGSKCVKYEVPMNGRTVARIIGTLKRSTASCSSPA